MAVLGRAWLLVSVSAAGGVPGLRMYVWQALRGLGAVPVGPSGHLLPDLDLVDRKVRRLVDRVLRDGGAAQVWHIEVTNGTEVEQLVEQVQTARDAEYVEVEVEENEADLARFHGWLAKIDARDYFTAPVGAQARQEFARAAAALASFEAAAITAEDPPTATDRPHLRSLPAAGDH